MKGIMLKDLYENFYIKKNLASYIFGTLIIGLAAFFFRHELCLYTLYNAFDYCLRLSYTGSLL